MEKRNSSRMSESKYAQLNDVQLLDAEDPQHDSPSTFAPVASSDAPIFSQPYRRRLRSYPDLRPAKTIKYTVGDDCSSDYTPSGPDPRYPVDDDATSDYTLPGAFERCTADDDPSSDYTPSSGSEVSSLEPRSRRRHRRRRGLRASALKPATRSAPETRSSNDDLTNIRGSKKALPKHNPNVGPSSELRSQPAFVAELRALYTHFHLAHELIVGPDWCAYPGWLLSMLPFAQEQMQLNHQLEASRGEIGSEEFYGTHNHILPSLSFLFISCWRTRKLS